MGGGAEGFALAHVSHTSQARVAVRARTHVRSKRAWKRVEKDERKEAVDARAERSDGGTAADRRERLGKTCRCRSEAWWRHGAA